MDKICGYSTGHSRCDPGAEGINGIKEYPLNVALTDLLGRFILSGGSWVRTDLEFEDDPYPDYLVKTILRCNTLKVDIAVELHHNFVSNPKVRGGQTIYWDTSKQGHILAELVSQNINMALTNVVGPLGAAVGFQKTIPITEYGYAMRDYKSIAQIGRRLGFLRRTNMPAIIIEPGFLSNENDVKLVQDKRLEIATGIYRGIQQYINQL